MTAGAGVRGVAAIGLAGVVLRHRLPDPMPVRWGIVGHPDGHLPRVVAFAGFAALWSLFCALALVRGRKGWERRAVRAGSAPCSASAPG